MLLMYQFIMMLLLLIQSKTLGGPIEDIGWSNRRHWVVQSRKPLPRVDRFVIFFNNLFSKFINDFLVINSLVLKIKYKLYVSILSVFKFIIRGPNPGNPPLQTTNKNLAGAS